MPICPDCGKLISLRFPLHDCKKKEKTVYYTYQCNRCFIISGHSGSTPEEAPYCCGGEQMRAIRHEQETSR